MNLFTFFTKQEENSVLTPFARFDNLHHKLIYVLNYNEITYINIYQTTLKNGSNIRSMGTSSVDILYQ